MREYVHEVCQFDRNFWAIIQKFHPQAKTWILWEPMSFTDHQKLKWARGHLFCCHTETRETYRIYQSVGPTVHELKLFSYSFLNAAMFVLNLVLNAYWVVRTSGTGTFVKAMAAAGVKFPLRALISYNFCVAGFPIEAFWLCSAFTRISWPPYVNAETRHLWLWYFEQFKAVVNLFILLT